jgi:hypothetical protein
MTVVTVALTDVQEVLEEVFIRMQPDVTTSVRVYHIR